MYFLSLTRLRIRSLRYLPGFALYSWRTLRQARAAPGFCGGKLLPDRAWTFWTMTAWRDQQAMRSFMSSGAHKSAMPHLLEWCDEASVAHWELPELQLPAWEEADQKMREIGRPSKVKHPSADHATLNYAQPRTSGSTAI